jgi:hypothetical protein
LGCSGKDSWGLMGWPGPPVSWGVGLLWGMRVMRLPAQCGHVTDVKLLVEGCWWRCGCGVASCSVHGMFVK